MKTKIKVAEAMTKNPILVNKEDTITDCLNKMVQGKVGSAIIVSEDKEILGIITEKDIIVRMVLKNKKPESTKVKEVMTTEINSIEPNKDLYDAMLLMSKLDTKRLPVIENKKFVGLITYKDILRIHPALLEIVLSNFEIREREKLNQNFY